MSERGTPLAAALRTPPFNLVVARPRTAEALVALADAVNRESPDLPGVTAALPEADAFAELWEERTGSRRRPRMTQRVYSLTTVVPPRGVSGRARRATHTDRELLVDWLNAFAEEALAGTDAPLQDAERWVDVRLGGAGGFTLWEDGRPVSLAGWGGPTPNGVRVGPVYTHPSIGGAARAGCCRAAAAASARAS